jgi:hypothetical protein
MKGEATEFEEIKKDEFLELRQKLLNDPFENILNDK